MGLGAGGANDGGEGRSEGGGGAALRFRRPRWRRWSLARDVLLQIAQSRAVAVAVGGSGWQTEAPKAERL